MALTTKILGLVEAKHTNPLDLVTGQADHLFKHQLDWLNGTGVNQANSVWSDQRTVGDGATDSLDLAGSLTDAFGATITFTGIKMVSLFSLAANTTNLTITPPAVNGVAGLMTALADGIIIKPGGLFVWADPTAGGVTVTATTADLLDIVNAAGAAATFNIAIIGNI